MSVLSIIALHVALFLGIAFAMATGHALSRWVSRRHESRRLVADYTAAYRGRAANVTRPAEARQVSGWAP